MSGPPPSSIGVKPTSTPYASSRPCGPLGRALAFGVAAHGHRHGHVREVVDRGEAPFVGERLRHGVGVLVGRRRLVERPQSIGDGLLQLRVDVVAEAGLGVGVPVLEQRTGVLGKEVDRAGFELGHIGFALPDAELAVDGDVFGFEGLGVDLGDDLAGVVVLRADDDRVAVRCAAGERVFTGAAGHRERADECGGAGRGQGAAFHAGSFIRWVSVRAEETGAAVRAASRWTAASASSSTSARAATRSAPPSISGYSRDFRPVKR